MFKSSHHIEFVAVAGESIASLTCITWTTTRVLESVLLTIRPLLAAKRREVSWWWFVESTCQKSTSWSESCGCISAKNLAARKINTGSSSNAEGKEHPWYRKKQYGVLLMFGICSWCERTQSFGANRCRWFHPSPSLWNQCNGVFYQKRKVCQLLFFNIQMRSSDDISHSRLTHSPDLSSAVRWINWHSNLYPVDCEDELRVIILSEFQWSFEKKPRQR